MSPLVADGVALVLAVVVGWAVPAWAMAALEPSLKAARVVPNYRGAPVFLGLGLVWVIWAVGLLTVRVLLEAVGSVFVEVPDALFHLYSGSLGVAFTGMPILLVAFAFGFGLIDDVFGSSGDKGFRGHLRALRRGQITSGALKMFGIGLVSLSYGWSASARVVEMGVDGTPATLPRIGAWILATLVIGLSTNLFNLLDLRPGRALKSYALLVLPLGIAFAVRINTSFGEFAASIGDVAGVASALGPSEWVTMAVVSLIVLLGPVIAVWRYDLGERGMMGDAGSNVLGAVVGFLLVGVLPLWGYGVAACVLLGLNVASERISFSRVIEAVAPLRWLDSLGRLRVDAVEALDPTAERGRPPAGEAIESSATTE